MNFTSIFVSLLFAYNFIFWKHFHYSMHTHFRSLKPKNFYDHNLWLHFFCWSSSITWHRINSCDTKCVCSKLDITKMLFLSLIYTTFECLWIFSIFNLNSPSWYLLSNQMPLFSDARTELVKYHFDENTCVISELNHRCWFAARNLIQTPSINT